MQNPPTNGRRPPAYRHAALLASLLLVIVVSPFFGGRVSWLLEASLFLTLAAGALATSPGRGKALVLGIVSAVAIAGRLLHANQPEPGTLLFVFLGGYIAYFSIVVVALLRDLFARGARVTTDTLFGALSVYLICGLLWTMAYAVLEQLAPGSFQFPAGATLADPERFERFLGFSFTTLTTLGYGTIAPATPQADALTTLEAIVGQFYVAVVLARLVALHVLESTAGAEGPTA